MLGFTDLGALLAYLLTIAAAALCVVYGIVNWNLPSPEEERLEITEEKAWEGREDEIARPGAQAAMAAPETKGR